MTSSESGLKDKIDAALAESKTLSAPARDTLREALAPQSLPDAALKPAQIAALAKRLLSESEGVGTVVDE